MDSQVGGGGEMNSPRGKEMDGNQRERRPDMGHDPRGGPGEERKPETIKVVPGIWPGLRPAGEVRWGLPGISQRALNPCPFPSCPPGCLEGALPQSPVSPPAFLSLVGGSQGRVLPAPAVLCGFLWASPGCRTGLPEVCIWPWEPIPGSHTLSEDARPFQLFHGRS